MGVLILGKKMTLNELKKKGKFTNEQFGLIFGVTRQTIAKWLDDELLLPNYIKVYLVNIK